MGLLVTWDYPHMGLKYLSDKCFTMFPLAELTNQIPYHHIPNSQIDTPLKGLTKENSQGKCEVFQVGGDFVQANQWLGWGVMFTKVDETVLEI